MLTGRPPLPAARSSVFAAVCVALASGAHLQAAGSVPVAALPAGFALVYAGARALAGAERRLPVILPAVLVAQIVLHNLFEHVSGHAARHAYASVPVFGAHSHGGHRHPAAHGFRWPDDLADPSGFAAVFGIPGASEPGMLAGHLTAAIACAWWLRQGEAALFGVLCWLRALSEAWAGALLSVWIGLLAALVRGDTPAPRPSAAYDTARPPLRMRLLDHCVRRRGPPASLLPL